MQRILRRATGTSATFSTRSGDLSAGVTLGYRF